MICPKDRTQMVNFTKEDNTKRFHHALAKPMYEIVPLPSGGIANEEVYETWYVYECPKCGRQVKESYRCEVLLGKK